MRPLTTTYAKRDIHEGWESVYRCNPRQRRFNDAMMDRVLSLLNLPAEARVLDAGCGTGEHCLRIAREGYHCVAVDIAEHILRKAQRSVRASGLGSRVSLVCQNLEDLSFPDDTFDAVYCRGVLMHIPNWTAALRQVCRVLKPGGKIIILESNHTSLETWLVLLVRLLLTRRSRVIRTQDGLEFWSGTEGQPFLVRATDIRKLVAHLEAHGVNGTSRQASEFFDINRFPAGLLRDTVIQLNCVWFGLRLPAFLSAGNVVIGEKMLRPPVPRAGYWG